MPCVTDPGGRRPPGALLAALTGTLMVLSFPRYGARYHLDSLIWVTLVPLFAAARGTGWRRGFLLGWAAGMTLESAGFVWLLHAIRSFTAAGAILPVLAFGFWALYSSLPWGLLGLAVGRTRKAAELLAVLPLWVGIEHYWPRLFPWHLGGALYQRAWLLQCADLLGASGLTALVFLTSATLYRALLWWRSGERFPARAALLNGLLLGAALTYGAWRLEDVRRQEAALPELRVACVQAAIDPRDQERRERSLSIHLDHTDRLLGTPLRPDLVVWPEGADPCPFWIEAAASGDRGPERDLVWLPHHRLAGGEATGRLRRLAVPLVSGGALDVLRRLPEAAAGGRRVEIEHRFHVAYFLLPGEPPRFYRKVHRMPFGEVFPLVDWYPSWLLDWLERLEVSVQRVAAGRETPLFELRGHPFRCAVCYEAVLPRFVPRLAEGADFLVNVTEDYWYGRTAHVPQHVSVLILRAVENRVPIVRAANAGPSGVIGASGTFTGTPRAFEEARWSGPLRPGRLRAFYPTRGSWFPLVCLVAGLALQLPLSRGGGRTRRQGHRIASPPPEAP